MKYYIIAGEASGDLHGSNLIKGLREADKDCSIRFWGGDLMAQAAQSEPVVHYKEGAIMGFWEVFVKAGRLLGNIRRCKRDILEWKPDAVILIDYPGFNMRIAKFAHSHGIPAMYYIAPKVWGWKEGRVKKMKKWLDHLFIIFPFEVEYFKRKQLDATYVGNPLIDSVNSDRYAHESCEEFISRHHLSDTTSVALLAGSRKGEISTMMPVLLETIRIMRKRGHKDLQYILAGAPSMDRRDYTTHIEKYLSEHPDADITVPEIIFGETYSVMRHCGAGIINSGTASLEAALLNLPQAVGYIASEISYQIAKRVVKLKYISLGNLILDKGAFREFFQKECNAEALADELEKLLYDNTYRNRMLEDYAEIARRLGGPGASVRVAKEVVKYLNARKGN